MPLVMRTSKATKSQVRQHNRQLILRSIYTEAATNRAALAQETGLTKPAVSDLVTALMEEGLLIEEGFGESTDSGGKRPRLLRFLPGARQVIGISINQQSILGVLTNLDGRVLAEHTADLPTTEQTAAFEILAEVINGLIAQLSAPLMCIGVGISAIVDDGVIRYAPRFGWRGVALREMLTEVYQLPIYVSNSTELAALAQIAFGAVKDVSSLVTVLISNSVGIGAVMSDATFQIGTEIGTIVTPASLPLLPAHTIENASLQDLLGWQMVYERALALGQDYQSPFLKQNGLSYLHIRHAAARDDQAAKVLHDQLSSALAQVFAWAIAMLRPHHISLAGALADLGEAFLNETVTKTRALVLPDLVDMTTFSVDDTPNLVAIGAAAKAIQFELGLV